MTQRGADQVTWNLRIVDVATGFGTPEFLRVLNSQRQFNGDFSALLAIEFIAGLGLDGGGTLGDLTNITFDLADTAVTPGSYTNANITVDQQGRITAAASGSSSGGTGGVLPLVNGDLPGPGLIVDPFGQLVGVPLS